jgi:hypothetical protein
MKATGSGIPSRQAKNMISRRVKRGRAARPVAQSVGGGLVQSSLGAGGRLISGSNTEANR